MHTHVVTEYMQNASFTTMEPEKMAEKVVVDGKMWSFSIVETAAE